MHQTRIKQLFCIAQYVICDYCAHTAVMLACLLLISSILIGWLLATLLIADVAKVYVDCVLASFQGYILLNGLLYGAFWWSDKSHVMSYGLMATRLQSRTTLYLGILFGLIGVQLALALALYASGVIMLFYMTQQWFWYLWPAYLVITLEGLFIQALALFFGIFMHPSLAAFCLLCSYSLCYITSSWLAAIGSTASVLTMTFAYLAYYLLPDLTLIDIKAPIVHEYAYDLTTVAQQCCYILLYICILYLATWKIFCRKNLS